MLGIVFNLILASLAVLALAAGISFFLQEPETGYLRGYILLFGVSVFFICAGYSIMALMPETEYAFIPRLIGLYGVDVFLLIELAFLTMELRMRQGYRGVILGFFVLYLLFDLILFGKPSALHYVRYDFHTAYENRMDGSFIFHYSYVIAICIVLVIYGVKWYQSKKIKRDKQFALEIIVVNLALLCAAFPDMFNLAFARKYPTFSFCLAYAFIHFSFWLAVKRHIMFAPTVKNVSQEIFYSVDVSVLIIGMDGSINLFNPKAEHECGIGDGTELNLRGVFDLSDVETLRLLAHAKKSLGGVCETRVKANGKVCRIHCAIRLDNNGEPFCIIGTVLFPLKILSDAKEIEQ